MNYIKALFASAVVAFAIIFMIQNIDPLSHPLSIRLNLFFTQFHSTPYPTYLIIILTFFVGLFLASVLGYSERRRFRRLLKEQQKEVDNLSGELNSLRNLPLTGEAISESGAPEPLDLSAEEKETLS